MPRISDNACPNVKLAGTSGEAYTVTFKNFADEALSIAIFWQTNDGKMKPLQTVENQSSGDVHTFVLGHCENM